MPAQKIPLGFDDLKREVTSYFPDQLLSGMVLKTDQQIELESLKQTLGGKRFFFIIDLASFEIVEIHGLERWLGYPERDFTLKKYWSIVSPKRREWLMILAVQVYRFLCTGKYPLSFMVQRFGSLVPLRHYNGQELLAVKTSSVFQYDSENRLMAYVNEFTIVGPYDGEPLAPDFYTSSGEQKKTEAVEIMEHVIGRIIQMRVFSAKEIQVARVLAYHPGIPQTQISAYLKLKNNKSVSYNTVRTYCKRFLGKARAFFGHDFKTCQEAATFLKKEGLI